MKHSITLAIFILLFLIPSSIHAQVAEQDALVIYTDDSCQLVQIPTTTTDLYNHPEVWFPGSINKQNQLRNYASTAELGVFIRISQRIFVVITYIVTPHLQMEMDSRADLHSSERITIVEDIILDAVGSFIHPDLLKRAAELISAESGVYVMRPEQEDAFILRSTVAFATNQQQPLRLPAFTFQSNLDIPLNEIHLETSKGRVRIVNVGNPEHNKNKNVFF